MPQDKKWTGGSIRVTEEAIQNIRKIAKRSGLIQPEILDTLLNMCVVHDLLNPDWQERLNAALRRGEWQLQLEAHFKSKEKCVSFRGADMKWKCIKGRVKRTPMIRILAENRVDALNLCEGCTVSLEPVLKNYEYQETIQNLKDKLNKNADLTFKAPVCEAGGILNGDGTEFSRCQDRGGFVDVKKYCKKKNEGKGCTFYSESVIGFAEKIE